MPEVLQRLSRLIMALVSADEATGNWMQGAGRHLLVLAILSYNDLPAEYVSGLSKC